MQAFRANTSLRKVANLSSILLRRSLNLRTCRYAAGVVRHDSPSVTTDPPPSAGSWTACAKGAAKAPASPGSTTRPRWRRCCGRSAPHCSRYGSHDAGHGDCGRSRRGTPPSRCRCWCCPRCCSCRWEPAGCGEPAGVRRLARETVGRPPTPSGGDDPSPGCHELSEPSASDSTPSVDEPLRPKLGARRRESGCAHWSAKLLIQIVRFVLIRPRPPGSIRSAQLEGGQDGQLWQLPGLVGMAAVAALGLAGTAAAAPAPGTESTPGRVVHRGLRGPGRRWQLLPADQRSLRRRDGAEWTDAQGNPLGRITASVDDGDQMDASIIRLDPGSPAPYTAVGGYQIRDVLAPVNSRRGCRSARSAPSRSETCRVINSVDGNVVETSVFSLEGDSGSPGFVKNPTAPSAPWGFCRPHRRATTTPPLHRGATGAGAVGTAHPAVTGVRLVSRSHRGRGRPARCSTTAPRWRPRRSRPPCCRARWFPGGSPPRRR